MHSKENQDKCQQASMTHIRPSLFVNTINEFTGEQSQFFFEYVDWYDYAARELELSSFMYQLFVKQRSCCLVHICETRRPYAPHLTKLLAMKLVEYLGTLEVNLQKIEIELLGIRQNDIINMLTEVVSSTKNRKENRDLWPRLTLSSMLTFLQWIGTTYVQLVSAGRQHECLDLTLYLQDDKNQINKVNLATIQVYVNEMDKHNKFTLHRFLKNPKVAKKSNHSMLTTFLSDYLAGTDEWLTWLLVDMPTVEDVCVLSEDIFMLGSAAFEGLVLRRQCTPTDVNSSILWPDTTVFSPYIKRTNSEEPKKSNIGKQQSFIDRLTTKLQSNFKDPESSDQPGSWYRTVAKVFNELVKAMQDYYDQMYLEVIDNMYLAGNSTTLVNEMHNFYDEYKAANVACSDLAKKLELISHDPLSSYDSLKTRRHELAKSMSNMKPKFISLEHGKKLLHNLLEKEKILLDALKDVE